MTKHDNGMTMTMEVLLTDMQVKMIINVLKMHIKDAESLLEWLQTEEQGNLALRENG